MVARKTADNIAAGAPAGGLIDSHCHLDMSDYADDLDQVLGRAAAAGVVGIVTIGIDPASSRAALALAGHHRRVAAAVGIHPHHVAEAAAEDYRSMMELARQPEVVAYGEIGLDYARNYAPPEVQRNHLVRQLDMARQLGLPVILHDRDAHADMLRILKDAQPLPAGGVMHCFSGDLGLAEEVLALGLHISIPGIVTFRNATAMQEVAARIPLAAMLLETDGPYLSPEPKRGKRNESAYLVHVARKIAALRGCDVEEVCRRTTDNARALFGLPEDWV